MNKPSKPTTGVQAAASLSRIFHEKARLAIMTALASHPDGLSFGDLKELCDLSDGNLNSHLEVLQECHAVSVERSGAGRGSRSVVKWTASGRQQFQTYLSELERVLKTAVNAIETVKQTSRPTKRTGLSDA